MEWSQIEILNPLCKVSIKSHSRESLRTTSVKQYSKVDSKLYLDIFIAAIQWGENVNLLFCWERFNGLCRNCWWRDIADIHSYSTLSIWSYFPNFWLYNTMPPGAHFNTIKQDCRKILKFWRAIIINGEGFFVIMAKKFGRAKGPLCPSMFRRSWL